MFIALLLSVAQAEAKSPLIGEWRIVEVAGNGPAKLLKDNVRSLAIDAATITAGRVAKYTADLKKKTIDLTIDGGPKNEQGLYPGIFEVKGAELKLHFAQPGKERPKDFTAHDGSFVITLKLK